MDYKTILKYLPFAQGAYGLGKSDSVSFPVGSFVPVKVEGFTPTQGQGFNGVLYRDPDTGEYVIGIAGTTVSKDNAGFDGADAKADLNLAFQASLQYVSAWHQQFSDAVAFAGLAVKTIQRQIRDETGQEASLDDVRERLSVAGHSLGGSQAELVAALLGIKGVNIDGPGISTLLESNEFKAAQKVLIENIGLREHYDMTDVGFVANGWTVVSQPGTHIDGSNFDSLPGAKYSYLAAYGMLYAGALVGQGLITTPLGLAVAGYNAMGHPTSAISADIESRTGLSSKGLDFDTFGYDGLHEADLFKNYPNVATAARWYTWVGKQREDAVTTGLSPSGYVLNQEQQSKDGMYYVTASVNGNIYTESYRSILNDEKFERQFSVRDGEVGVFNKDGALQFVRADAADPGALVLITIDKTTSTLDVRNINSFNVASNRYALTPDQAENIRKGEIPLLAATDNSLTGIKGLGREILVGDVAIRPELAYVDGRTYLLKAGTGEGDIPAVYEAPVGVGGWYERINADGRYLFGPDGSSQFVPVGQQVIADGPNGRPLIGSRDVLQGSFDEDNKKITLTSTNGAVTVIKLGPDLREISRTVTLQDKSGNMTSTDLDDRGNVKSVVTVTTDKNGRTSTTVAVPGQSAHTDVVDSQGRLFETRDTTFSGSTSQTKVYDPSKTLKSTIDVVTNPDKSTGVTTSYVDGGWTRETYAGDKLISSAGAMSPLASFGTAVSDINSLVGAIRSGQAIPILSSGLKLLNNQINPNVSGTQVIANQPLFTTTAVAGAVGSLYGLYNVFANGGSALQKVSATAGALVAVNSAANAIYTQATGKLAGEIASTTLNGAASAVGQALPYINIVTSLAQGDYKGAAVAVAAAMNVPYIGWAYAAYMLVSSILHDEPDAWGQAKFKFGDSTQITLDTVGYGLGKGKVDLLMKGNGLDPSDPNYFGGLLGYLQDQVSKANHYAPELAIGIIPQRLPTLSWHQAGNAEAGYMLTDIDPITGEVRYPTLRYDDKFRVLNGDVTDPGQRPDLFSRLIMSALSREALAAMWEVQTARKQQDLGDPEAGLTEEQRAARHGWTAPAGADGKRLPGKFLPVVLDLDGDGRIATTDKDHSGVSFNWDDSGYLKDTAWINASDGFLTLDRNLNGLADGGKDLFSNSNVADEAKGLRSMRWADANLDGVIDANDPVFQALRVWRDLNQDGIQDKNETSSLADLGITSIDYGNGRYTKGGSQFLVRSQELEAENDGIQVSYVKGGIQIDYSNGKSTVFVANVLDDEGQDGAGTDFIAKNDRLDWWEDGTPPGDSGDPAHPIPQKKDDHRTIGLQFNQLLGNDRILPGHSATITGVGNATHGTVSINAESQTVEFLPDHNYNGSASFTYTVTDDQNRTRTATVTLNLQPVADEASTKPVPDQRAIFGYAPLATIVETGGSAKDREHEVVLARDQGQVMYSPYQTVMGRRFIPGGEQDMDRYGDWEDTGILLSTFQRNYAYINHTWGSGENGPVGSIRLKINGIEYGIEAEPQIATHDTPVTYENSSDGVIRVDAPDNPGAVYRFEKVGGPSYGNATVDPNTGRYTYTGRRYVQYDFDGNVVGHDVDTNDHIRGDLVKNDVFTVKVIDTSDPSGKTFTLQEVTVPHYGDLPMGDVGGGGGKKPIAIDLNNDGFHFKDVDDSNVFFDVNGDGWKRRMAWNNGSDGFIAFDKNGDGKITDFDEISFVPYLAGSQTDLEGLAGFDTNHDGKFSAADEKWASFGVWQDANENGITDAGEFRSLDSLGINAIQLGSDGHFQVIDGQTVNGIGSATRTDGGSYALADVTLRYKNETQGKTDGGEVVTAPIAPFSKGEVFNGTDGADLVFGTAGSDQYHLGAGNDVVSDGDGDDMVESGDGDDIVMTGAGNDFIDAGNGNDQIFADVGDDIVIAGAGDDFVTAGDGNDVVFGGEGQDMISGGNGNDLLSGDQGDDQLFGESGRDVLFGMDGDDQLFGGENDDQLDGGAGNDLLDGGTGADVMIGGAGNDRYAVDNVGDVVTEAENGGYDSVTVDNLADYTLGANVEALVLGKNAINGTGNALDNALWGNDAANRLDGREGADTMSGGAGDDTYVVDNAGDQVVEYANKGNDTVLSSVDYTLGANVENLVLSGNAVKGTGNLQDNVLTGNDLDNVLVGGGGRDTMIGGRGNDRYVVDSADDVVVEQAGEGVDSVESSVSYTLGANVENLTLTGSGNLDGTGSNVDNVITGNAGNNRLDGGAGADTLIGGAGNDTYVVDNSADVVVERAGEGLDEVLASADYTLGDNVEKLTLTGAAVRGTGNALDNVITGNDAGNRLDGAGGHDTLIGGRGNDTYVVDGLDDVIVEQAGEGTDTVEASLDYVLGAELENLTLLAGAAIHATGNAADNVITGNDNANVLDGVTGSDTLIGGRGDDLYRVDSSDDVVVERAGEGHDTVESTASYTLSANIETLLLQGDEDLDGTGNAQDNTIVGTTGNNRLDGAAGADTLIGGEGDDTYIVDNVGDVVVELAGEGHDTVESSVDYTLADGLEDLRLKLGAHVGIGNAADNVLEGLAMDGSDHGDDGRVTLRGEGGNDTLITNLGGDRMIGGTGDDTYVINKLGFDGEIIEAADEGIDTVRSYANIELSANVENLTLLGYANRGVGNELANVIIAAERGSEIFGLAGDDTMVGNSGDDLLDGGTGADLMSGGAGDDRYVVDDAGDVVVEEAGGGGNAETQQVIDGIKSSWSWLPGGAGVVDAVVDYVRARPGQDIVWSDMIADIEQQGVGDTWILILYASQFQPLLTLDYAGGGTAGGGNDTVTASIDYTLTDNVENLVLSGNARLSGTGNALDNELIGNAGNNRLDGGAGADLMAGGRGDDVYIVDNAGDRIVEGVAGDRPWSEGLRLATEELKRMAGDGGWSGNIDGAMAQIDAALTAAAADGVTDVFGVDLFGIVSDMVFSEALLANKVRSLLWDRLSMVAPEGDIDGGHDVVYASVDFEAGLGIEDVVLTGDAISATGNALDNRLTGNEMDNELTGGDGNDHLFGGAGNDLIIGGTGNDTLVGGTGDDVFAWADGDGFDVVTDESGQDVLSFGEGLTADSFDYVTEEIDGHQRTTLIRLDAEGHATAEGVQLNGSAATGFEIEEIRFADGTTRSVQDLLAAIDTRKQPVDDGSRDFVGTDGDDTFYLSDAPRGVINRYHGGGGTDTILGGWGYDYLNVAPDLGNLQSIEVLDGVGSDFRSNFIWGTDGADRWDFSGMTVRNFVMASGAGDDTIIGTAGDDMIEGGKGTDDLSGGDGNDTFILTAGDDGVDRYDGGSGDNRIYADWGYNVLRVSSTLDSLRNIQRIESVDNNFGAARIVATDGDDTLDFTGILVRNFMIDAGDGNDVVIGGDGDEWIRGGKGADILSGGAGNDTFLLTPGDYEVDHFDGGLGSNRIFADWGTTVLRVGSTLASVQNIQKIEGVETTLGAARIVSTDGDDTLDFSGITVKNFLIDTGDGNDVVIGGDGDDWIRGGKGSDVLSGGAGDDMFVLTAGDEGVDRYDGGSGTNRIFADWGYNVLRVSSTMDSLRNIQRIESVDANFGAARIVATDGDDTLDFTGISLKNFMIDTGDGDDVVTGSADADTIRGGKGRDTLSGGGGDDLYLWQKGDGDDHISDTAGDNTLDLGSYLDPAGVTVATTETGWQLQVRHDGQMSLLTIDRYQASTMKVRIDSNTWSIDSLPAGDYVTPWDASGGAAMAKGAGWASMDAGDSQRPESDHATTGLIGGGSSPRRSTTL